MSLFGFTYSMGSEEIKKIYRAKVMNLHPDKINQKHGRAPTEQEAADYLKLTEEFKKFREIAKMYDQKYQENTQKQPSPFTAPPPPPQPSPQPSPQTSPKTSPGQGWTKSKKQRCCSQCKQPGHTKTTCPEINPRKAARRERKQQNQQEKTQQKTEENTQNNTFTVQFENVKQTINLRFAVPTGVKAGDVIQIPYFNRSGESCVHDFKIQKFQLGRPFLHVSIAF